MYVCVYVGQHREQEEFRVRSEGQLLKLAGLSEQVAALQTSMEVTALLLPATPCQVKSP